MTSGFRTFGVVVVGIGTAGRVRLRDLQECGSTISLELKGFVSRHESEIPGVTKLSYEECLARSDIHAVIICTEPHTHENLIRQALYSNKHVLVEYPVALSSQIAHDLYQQANRKGLVLHEENIRLLTESHKSLKEMATAEQLKCARSNLTGNYNGWVEKLPLEGKPLISSVSAIQAFYDIFGDMKAVGSTLDILDDGFQFTGKFVTTDGEKEVSVSGSRYKQKTPRQSHVYVEFESGRVFDSSVDKPSTTSSTNKSAGLFMQDLKLFAAELCGEHETGDRSAMSIRCLELAEQADAFIKVSA